MKRRSFFQTVGTAFLGTIIALKVPDSLIPTIKEEAWRGELFTWQRLKEIYYDSMGVFGNEPNLVLLSTRQYHIFLNSAGLEETRNIQRNGIAFMTADVIHDDSLEDGDFKIIKARNIDTLRYRSIREELIRRRNYFKREKVRSYL